ncbi:MAG: DUF58 domain-containing protein [Planctomycetia bacterium]|nr:DUF58 domain-containing protein [Planctomycetia bacterium]
MPRQRRIRICREGVYYILVVVAVLAGGTARQLNLLMLLGSMLAGPLLFSFIYGRLALRRIEVGRKLPSQTRADQRLVVDVRVTNFRRWLTIWTIQVEDVVQREGTFEDPGEKLAVSVFYSAIAARETKQVSYDGRLPQRGRYRFGPLRVSTRFPLGLVRHSLLLEQNEELIVHPKIGRLANDWAQVVRESPTGSQSMSRRGLLEADFYGLRDWRPGDSRRSIHWRTSARRGSFVVRQFEQRRSQDLALLVDLWQPPEATDEQLENVETAISFVATVIDEACRQSGRYLVLEMAAHEPLCRAGTASPLFFREQMDALSFIMPHHEPQFPPSLGHAVALVPPSLPILLISTRPIDYEALREAAAERDVQLTDRSLRGVNVAGDDLAPYFQV